MRKRIMVVDASETILDVCRSALTSRGYDAVVHNDGQAALRDLQQGGYDLAVIATETDAMPGYQLVGRLRATDDTKNLPVLMLIGSSELLEPDELLSAGPDATLTKPFAPQELLHKIDSLLLRPAAQPEAQRAAEADLTSVLESEPEFSRHSEEQSDLQQFLSAISETTPQPVDRTQDLVDRVDLVDGETGPQMSDAQPDEEWTPHITEAQADETPESVPSIGLDEFDTHEQSGINLGPDSVEDSSEAEQIYLEAGPSDEVDHGIRLQSAESEVENLKAEFVRELAQALAKEIAAKIDFEKILARLDESLTSKERY